MGAILRWIVGPIAGPAFGILALVLGIGWATTTLVARSELSTVTADRDRLKDQIDNPSTGYLARTAQCETNVAGLQVGLDATRRDIQKLGDASAANDRAVRGLMAKAAALAGDAQAKAARLLATPATAPIGSLDACTAGARILKGGAP